MDAARIGVDTAGIRNLFTQIAEGLNLTNGAGERIADILRSDALRQFQEGGEPHWRPLSPITIERKMRLGYPRLNRQGLVPQRMIQRGAFGPENILMMTGALLSSWTDAEDPHHFVEITEDNVSIGSDLPYAGTMQHGGEGFNGAPIPARPVVVTGAALSQIAQVLEQAALGGNP